MKLTDWIQNNIRIFHRVTHIPTIQSSKGIYFVWNEQFTGLYIVTDKSNVKSVKKIFHSSDYYLTQKIDQIVVSIQDRIQTLNNRLGWVEANKVDKSEMPNASVGIKQYKPGVPTQSALPMSGNEHGDARVVADDLASNGRAYIWLWNGTKWSRTPFTEFPSDVLRMSNLDQKLGNSTTTAMSQDAVTKALYVTEFKSYEELKAYRDAGKCISSAYYSFPYICKYKDTFTGEIVEVNTEKTIILRSHGYWFDHNAYFLGDPATQILYDFDNNIGANWGIDKGVIYYMQDVNNNSAYFDFQHIKFKRFKFDIYPYESTIGYNIGNFVQYGKKIFICLFYCKNIRPDSNSFGKYWIPILDLSKTEYVAVDAIEIELNNKTYMLDISDDYHEFKFLNDYAISTRLEKYINSSGAFALPDIVVTSLSLNSYIKGYNSTLEILVNADLQTIEDSIFSREIKNSTIGYCKNVISSNKHNESNLNYLLNVVFSTDDPEFQTVFSNDSHIENSIILKAIHNSSVKGSIFNSIIGYSYDSDIFRVQNKLNTRGFINETINGVETLELSDKMKWWDESRIGLFIHWGLYSVFEGRFKGVNRKGVSVDWVNARDGQGVGAEWILKTAQIPEKTYLSRLSELKSSSFDVDSIAAMASAMKAGYLVITVKHHEGVCMWGAANDAVNILKSSVDFTLLIRLKEACRQKGIRFGVYFSQNYDWTKLGGFGQDWKSYTKQNHENYVKGSVLAVLDEIFQNLDPDILWWDIPSGNTYEDLATKIDQHVKKFGKRELITNDRLSAWHKGDFGTGEGSYYKGSMDYAENCFFMNRTWGYDKDLDTPQYYVSAQVVLYRYLIESASRGQNTMLNISPKGNGEIPVLQSNILDQVGDWMALNYEAIVGTSKVLTFSNPNFGRLTQRDSKLYILVLNNATTIHLDGISTHGLLVIRDINQNIIDYTIDGNDRVTISNFRSGVQNDYPLVLVAYYGGTPFIFDYVNVDASIPLNAIAFRFNDLSLERNNGVFNFGAYFGGTVKTRIKWIGATGSYWVDLVNLMKRGNTSFTLQIIDKSINQSTKVVTRTDRDRFDKRISLVKNQIYDVELTNNGQNWCNFQDLIFS